MDRHTRLAALFLLLAPGPLAEVLSQNVQLLTFLQPVPFLLVTLTYGVPVLVIRELAVARKLNDMGLILLGLAYGILNEGLCWPRPSPCPPELRCTTLPAMVRSAGAGRLVGLHHRLACIAQRVLPDSPDAMDVSLGRRSTVVCCRAHCGGLLYVLVVLLAGLTCCIF
jgi:hypothetical protein